MATRSASRARRRCSPARGAALCALAASLSAFRLLHNSGDIVYFDEDATLKDFVILKPSGSRRRVPPPPLRRSGPAAGHVDALHDEASLGEERYPLQDGPRAGAPPFCRPLRLTTGRSGASFPPAIHETLLLLLTKFEIAQLLPADSLPSAESTPPPVAAAAASPELKWIVPALLSKDRPPLAEIDAVWPRSAENMKQIVLHVERLYRFQFLPHGAPPSPPLVLSVPF